MKGSWAALVTLNDIRNPRTGGDEVYRSILAALESAYGSVRTVTLAGSRGPASWLVGFSGCYAAPQSLLGEGLVFTSSSLTFPVPGHATYHQPKGGMHSRYADGESAGRRLAFALTEHEWLSPLWLRVKKGIPLHLINREYTRGLVGRLYGVESMVVYPPVRPPSAPRTRKGRTLLVTKPERVWVVVIGRIDDAGRRALGELRRTSVEHAYLGYVKEHEKSRVMAEASVHLNLVVNETFGLSTFEAMGHGAIPVAHRSWAPPEYLDGRHLYADAGEAREIAAQFIDVGEEEREEARRTASRFSEQRFREALLGALGRIDDHLKEAAAD
jgi:hypothetical protein